MAKHIEMALRLFLPLGPLYDADLAGKGLLGREEILGALQVAATGRSLGYHYLMADYLMDYGSVRALSEHFEARLGVEMAGVALSLLLRRPLPDQLERMIKVRSCNAHPYYEKERRRAAIVMERARRAHRRGNNGEYQRLKSERDGILMVAYERCANEILQTGRCPVCQGTGRRVRVGTECQPCNGTGKIAPDRAAIARRFGEDRCHAIEREVDEVLAQSSELRSVMRRNMDQMLAA